MDLASARSLKGDIRRRLTGMLAQPQIASKLGVAARRIEGVSAPRSIALGIRVDDDDYKIAVRLQQPREAVSELLQEITAMAGVDTEIRYVGKVSKRQLPQQTRTRPLRIGLSIGHFKITAGTLGCFVKPRSGGEAIYATHPWTQAKQWSAGEQPKVSYNQEFEASYDFAKLIAAPQDGKASINAFFTAKGDSFYAIQRSGRPGCFSTWASEDSNLKTNDLTLPHIRAPNGMNAMQFGSPPWTRFELLRHKTAAARTASSDRRATAIAPNRPDSPDWVPSLDTSRTRRGSPM